MKQKAFTFLTDKKARAEGGWFCYVQVHVGQNPGVVYLVNMRVTGRARIAFKPAGTYGKTYAADIHRYDTFNAAKGYGEGNRKRTYYSGKIPGSVGAKGLLLDAGILTKADLRSVKAKPTSASDLRWKARQIADFLADRYGAAKGNGYVYSYKGSYNVTVSLRFDSEGTAKDWRGDERPTTRMNWVRINKLKGVTFATAARLLERII